MDDAVEVNGGVEGGTGAAAVVGAAATIVDDAGGGGVADDNMAARARSEVAVTIIQVAVPSIHTIICFVG